MLGVGDGWNHPFAESEIDEDANGGWFPGQGWKGDAFEFVPPVGEQPELRRSRRNGNGGAGEASASTSAAQEEFPGPSPPAEKAAPAQGAPQPKPAQPAAEKSAPAGSGEESVLEEEIPNFPALEEDVELSEEDEGATGKKFTFKDPAAKDLRRSRRLSKLSPSDPDKEDKKGSKKSGDRSDPDYDPGESEGSLSWDEFVEEGAGATGKSAEKSGEEKAWREVGSGVELSNSEVVQRFLDEQVKVKTQEALSSVMSRIDTFKEGLMKEFHLPKSAATSSAEGGSISEQIMRFKGVMKGMNACVICKRGFKDAAALQKHLKNVHAQLRGYKCDVCKVECSTRAALERHVKLVHTSAGKFVCQFLTEGKMCGHACNSAFALEEHRKSKHVVFSMLCRHCKKGMRGGDKPFTSAKSLSQHESDCREDPEYEGPYTCPVEGCGATLTRRREVQGHLSRVHGQKGPRSG